MIRSEFWEQAAVLGKIEEFRKDPGKYFIYQFDAEICLQYRIPVQSQKTLQIARCRVWGIELGKRRSYEE